MTHTHTPNSAYLHVHVVGVVPIPGLLGDGDRRRQLSSSGHVRRELGSGGGVVLGVVLGNDLQVARLEASDVVAQQCLCGVCENDTLRVPRPVVTATT